VSLDEFVTEKIPKIRFLEEVNADVKHAFSVIESLLVHSYFEYLFVDVAVNKALQTFEMALKLRYKEVNNGAEWKKSRTLRHLIAWFKSENYFESDDQEFLDRIRNTRNDLSHPELNGFAGDVGFPWISVIVELINDLYEDRAARMQRKNIRDQMLGNLAKIVSNGARLITPGSEIWIYEAPRVLVNNRTIPHQYFVGLLPVLYDDMPQEPVILQLVNGHFSIEEDRLIATTEDEKEIELVKITDQKSLSAMKGWISKLQTDREISGYHSLLRYLLQEELIRLRRSFRSFKTRTD
jgi:hypothetical protein